MERLEVTGNDGNTSNSPEQEPQTPLPDSQKSVSLEPEPAVDVDKTGVEKFERLYQEGVIRMAEIDERHQNRIPADCTFSPKIKTARSASLKPNASAEKRSNASAEKAFERLFKGANKPIQPVIDPEETFVPKINKRSSIRSRSISPGVNGSVFECLFAEADARLRRMEENVMRPDPNTTFEPKITAKAACMSRSASQQRLKRVSSSLSQTGLTARELREERLREEEERRMEYLLKECTFQPQLVASRRNSTNLEQTHTSAFDCDDQAPVFERLYDKKKELDMHMATLRKHQEDMERKELTFKPYLYTSPPKRDGPDSPKPNDSAPAHERLFVLGSKAHKEAKVQQKREEVERDFTFKPTLIAKNPAKTPGLDTLSVSSAQAVHERLYQQHEGKIKKLQQAEAAKIDPDEEECTFKPNYDEVRRAVSRGKGRPSEPAPKHTRHKSEGVMDSSSRRSSGVFDRLAQDQRQTLREREMERQRAEAEGCTFQPSVNAANTRRPGRTRTESTDSRASSVHKSATSALADAARAIKATETARRRGPQRPEKDPFGLGSGSESGSPVKQSVTRPRTSSISSFKSDVSSKPKIVAAPKPTPSTKKMPPPPAPEPARSKTPSRGTVKQPEPAKKELMGSENKPVVRRQSLTPKTEDLQPAIEGETNSKEVATNDISPSLPQQMDTSAEMPQGETMSIEVAANDLPPPPPRQVDTSPEMPQDQINGGEDATDTMLPPPPQQMDTSPEIPQTTEKESSSTDKALPPAPPQQNCTTPETPQKREVLKRSEGCFALLLMNASNLPKMDIIGPCDAYVQFLVGSRVIAQSDHIPKSFSPVWNRLFSIEDLTPEEKSRYEGLTLAVYDKKMLGSDALIGKVFVQWPQFYHGGIFQVRMFGEKTKQNSILEFQIFHAQVALKDFRQGMQLDAQTREEMSAFASSSENTLITDLAAPREGQQPDSVSTEGQQVDSVQDVEDKKEQPASAVEGIEAQNNQPQKSVQQYVPKSKGTGANNTKGTPGPPVSLIPSPSTPDASDKVAEYISPQDPFNSIDAVPRNATGLPATPLPLSSEKPRKEDLRPVVKKTPAVANNDASSRMAVLSNQEQGGSQNEVVSKDPATKEQTPQKVPETKAPASEDISGVMDRLKKMMSAIDSSNQKSDSVIRKSSQPNLAGDDASKSQAPSQGPDQEQWVSKISDQIENL